MTSPTEDSAPPRREGPDTLGWALGSRSGRCPSILAGAAWCIFLVACGPGTPTGERTVFSFVEAVQSEDLDRLYCLTAGDAPVDRDEFAGWVRARYDAYLEGRERGEVELDGSGIALVKLLTLGRGTFFTLRGTRAIPDGGLVVSGTVRLAYAHIPLSGFPSGTTIYLAGTPPGRVRPVRIPARSEEITVEALETLDLVWTLVGTPGDRGCLDEWAVASVAPVDGTARTVEITWIF